MNLAEVLVWHTHEINAILFKPKLKGLNTNADNTPTEPTKAKRLQ